MSKLFDKSLVLYPPAIVSNVAREGNLKYFVLWLKLKRRHISSHSHSFTNKPSWYPGSKETYRRHLNKMIDLEWVKRDGKGFRLISLKKLYELEYNKFKDAEDTGVSFNHFKSIPNSSYQELLYEFQKIVIRNNYDQQIYNITTFTVDLQKIHCGKLREKYRKTLLRKNISNVCALADLDRSNRTNLSLRGCGNLFGKGAGYGNKLMKKLIEDKFLIRQVQTKFIPVAASNHKHFQNNVYYSTFVSKGLLFKKKTSIMLTSYLKNDQIEQYELLKKRNKSRRKKSNIQIVEKKVDKKIVIDLPFTIGRLRMLAFTSMEIDKMLEGEELNDLSIYDTTTLNFPYRELSF